VYDSLQSPVCDALWSYQVLFYRKRLVLALESRIRQTGFKRWFQLHLALLLLGRPLRVATMCSGTESPLLAMDKIGAATADLFGAKLCVDHVFSCEIEPFKVGLRRLIRVCKNGIQCH